MRIFCGKRGLVYDRLSVILEDIFNFCIKASGNSECKIQRWRIPVLLDCDNGLTCYSHVIGQITLSQIVFCAIYLNLILHRNQAPYTYACNKS